MSRTTHELAKAKHGVSMAALALKADPENMEKKLALVAALDDLERDRNTVQGAILKSLLGVNQVPNVLADDSVSKSAAQPEGIDSFAMTDRIRKRRAEDGIPGGPR